MPKLGYPTDEEVEAAIYRSTLDSQKEIRAESIALEPDGWLALRLVRGSVVRFLPSQVKELAGANVAQLNALEVYPGGATLACPSLDVYLSVQALVLGLLLGEAWPTNIRRISSALVGSFKTPAKTKAAKENGKKGGRPRKDAVAERSAEATVYRRA